MDQFCFFENLDGTGTRWNLQVTTMELCWTPLTTFEDRRRSIETVLARVKSRTRTEQTADALW
jgi:hypothetical protein